MQEVSYFVNGERNYMNMKGDTGPLVYPAGMIYEKMLRLLCNMHVLLERVFVCILSLAVVDTRREHCHCPMDLFSGVCGRARCYFSYIFIWLFISSWMGYCLVGTIKEGSFYFCIKNVQ